MTAGWQEWKSLVEAARRGTTEAASVRVGAFTAGRAALSRLTWQATQSGFAARGFESPPLRTIAG
jgi:hypothetical protein